jgi:hypothetical protein
MDSMNDTQEPKKRGRPAKQEPVTEQSAPVFSFALPEALAAGEVAFGEQFPADLKMRVQSEIGCLFTLSGCDIKAADGRLFTIARSGDTIEVFSA